MRKIVIISVLVGVIIGVGAFALMFNNVQNAEARFSNQSLDGIDCDCLCLDWSHDVENKCLNWWCSGNCNNGNDY